MMTVRKSKALSMPCPKTPSPPAGAPDRCCQPNAIPRCLRPLLALEEVSRALSEQAMRDSGA